MEKEEFIKAVCEGLPVFLKEEYVKEGDKAEWRKIPQISFVNGGMEVTFKTEASLRFAVKIFEGGKFIPVYESKVLQKTEWGERRYSGQVFNTVRFSEAYLTVNFRNFYYIEVKNYVFRKLTGDQVKELLQWEGLEIVPNEEIEIPFAIPESRFTAMRSSGRLKGNRGKMKLTVEGIRFLAELGYAVKVKSVETPASTRVEAVLKEVVSCDSMKIFRIKALAQQIRKLSEELGIPVDKLFEELKRYI